MWIENLLELWRDVPAVIRWTLETFFSVIVIRGIIANEITTELKERGLIKQGWLHRTLAWVGRYIPNQDRLNAIVRHYIIEGHTGEVVVCQQEQCAVIASAMPRG